MGNYTPELSKRLDDLADRAAALGFIGAFIAREVLDDGPVSVERLPTGCWKAASSSLALIFTEMPTPTIHVAAQLLLVDTMAYARFFAQRVSFDHGRTYNSIAIAYCSGLYDALGTAYAMVPRVADTAPKPDSISRREWRRRSRALGREARRELRKMAQTAAS